MKANNGFLSISVLLFVALFFSVVVPTRSDINSEFKIIKAQGTKKQSAELNFEQIVKKELYSQEINPEILKVKINQEIKNYINTCQEEWNIKDITTTKTENITLEKLGEISKVIVLRPAPNIYVKRYTITNGITKTLLLGFELKTSYSKTSFYFPKNYSAEVIVYK